MTMEQKIRVIHDALTGETKIEEMSPEDIAELESFGAEGTSPEASNT